MESVELIGSMVRREIFSRDTMDGVTDKETMAEYQPVS